MREPSKVSEPDAGSRYGYQIFVNDKPHCSFVVDGNVGGRLKEFNSGIFMPAKWKEVLSALRSMFRE